MSTLAPRGCELTPSRGHATCVQGVAGLLAERSGRAVCVIDAPWGHPPGVRLFLAWNGGDDGGRF